MLRHTQECRSRGFAFAADPSQQLAWSDGETIRRLIDGAAYLFSNDYEAALIEQKTGWTAAEILSRVGVRVITHGSSGAVVERDGAESIKVAAVAGIEAVDPTGVGDAFRAGFLGAVAWGLGHERAAQLGCVLASHVVETVGPQEYTLGQSSFLDRVEAAYGPESAAEVQPLLVCR
jgi:adenosine kinase